MTDEEAQQYIEFLRDNEMPEPAPEREKGFIIRNGSGAKVFGDVYGYYAASLAKEWQRKHLHQGISLGKCIRSANTGLLMASYRYIEVENPPTFKLYAKPYICRELDRQLKNEA